MLKETDDDTRSAPREPTSKFHHSPISSNSRSKDASSGAVNQGIDPNTVIKGYQNSLPNQERKKDFESGPRKKGVRTNSTNNFLKSDSKKYPGPASKFGDGDGSFWDRWLGPGKIPSVGSFSTGSLAYPIYGSKSEYLQYTQEIERNALNSERHLLHDLNGARLKGQHPRISHGTMNDKRHSKTSLRKIERKREFFEGYVSSVEKRLRKGKQPQLPPVLKAQSKHENPSVRYIYRTKSPPKGDSSSDIDDPPSDASDDFEVNPFGRTKEWDAYLEGNEIAPLDDLTKKYWDTNPCQFYAHSSNFAVGSKDASFEASHNSTDKDCLGQLDTLPTTRLHHLINPSKIERKSLVKARLSRSRNKTSSMVDNIMGQYPFGESIAEPLLFEENDTLEINLAHFGLGDNRSHRLGNSFEHLEKFHGLNVKDNRITPKSIVSILGHIQPEACLNTLDVSCNKIGHKGAFAVAKLLRSTKTLRKLSLQSTYFSDKDAILICNALAENNSLTSLNMASNKIGDSGGVALAELIECASTLEDLNVAWNSIRGDGAIAMAKALGVNTSLTSLKLGYNGFADVATKFIANSIEVNGSLNFLDLTQNNIGATATLVLANGLEANRNLEFLILDQNPIGQTGARAMLRLFGNGEEDTILSLQGCNVDIDDPLIFDPNELSEHYSLTLDSPYQRSILKDIIRKANRHLGVSLTNVDYDGKTLHVDHATDCGEPLNLRELRIGDKIWTGYDTGIITFDVHIIPHRPTLANALTNAALENLLNVVLNEKLSERNKQLMMRLACQDMFFTTAQVIYILNKIDQRNQSSRVNAAVELMQRIVDPEKMSLFHGNLDSVTASKVKLQIGQLYNFDITNPGDHYRLDLAKKYDRVILEKLLEINTVDAEYSKTLSKRNDTSQHGDWNNFRNAVYNDKKILPPHSIATKFRLIIPQRGLLEFDYTTPRRVPPHARPIRHKYCQNLLRDVGLMTDEEWAALKIGKIIRGKMGRRKARDLAKRKLEKQRGVNRDLEPGPKQVLKVIIGVIAIAETQINEQMDAEQELVDMNPLNTASSLYFDLLDSAEKLQLGLSDVNMLKSYVAKYEGGNILIRWFGTLANWLHESAHEGIRTPFKPAATSFFLNVYLALSNLEQYGGDGDAVMVDSKSVLDILESNFENVLRDCDDFTTQLEGTVEHIEKITINNVVGLHDGLDQMMRLWYFQDPVNVSSLIGDPLITDQETDDDSVSGHDFEEKELDENEKLNLIEKNALREKLLYPLHRTLSQVYITCNELIMITKLFPSKYPELRVQVIQKLFGRVVDIERFHVVLSAFDKVTEDLMWKRLGWLNIFNPSFPDREYYLLLSEYDQREIAKMLVYLAIAEPGENWQDELYWRSRFAGEIESDPIPGWELPTSWIDDGGIPKDGIISLAYYSGSDRGCAPVWKERAALQQRCLCGDGGWSRVMQYGLLTFKKNSSQ